MSSKNTVEEVNYSLNTLSLQGLACGDKETKENVIFVFNLQSNFMNFLRNLFASILGFFIAVFLLIAVFAGIAVAVNDTPQIVVSEKSVLKIQLEHIY